MTPIPVPKLSLLSTILVLCLMASITLVACRPATTTSEEVSLVWEAWNIIKTSYVEGAALDSEQAAGDMIVAMLDAGNKPPYPFLTELEEVRARPPRDVPKELIDVWKVWILFREKWTDVSPELLTGAALESMVASLDEGSASHLTPEAYARAQERLTGTYQGIGAFVTIQEGMIILSPMEQSPAASAGLESGDILREVDGELVEGQSHQEVVEKVRGPANTWVTLLVQRRGEEELIELSVPRGAITMVSVDRQLFPGAVGHIYISDFHDNTPVEVKGALQDLQRVDMLALILDLRHNPGGSIASAQEVVSHFLADGLFMYEINKEGNTKDWPITDGGIATEELPMVVLVNEFTGSAAEAVAGALQDTGRAQIIGTRTFGKGSASRFEELSDGSAMYLPVSHWYTPSGKRMQGAGIEPDIEVALTAEDIFLGRDSQLAEAYNYLDGLLPHFR